MTIAPPPSKPPPPASRGSHPSDTSRSPCPIRRQKPPPVSPTAQARPSSPEHPPAPPPKHTAPPHPGWTPSPRTHPHSPPVPPRSHWPTERQPKTHPPPSAAPHPPPAGPARRDQCHLHHPPPSYLSRQSQPLPMDLTNLDLMLTSADATRQDRTDPRGHFPNRSIWPKPTASRLCLHTYSIAVSSIGVTLHLGQGYG